MDVVNLLIDSSHFYNPAQLCNLASIGLFCDGEGYDILQYDTVSDCTGHIPASAYCGTHK